MAAPKATRGVAEAIVKGFDHEFFFTILGSILMMSITDEKLKTKIRTPALKLFRALKGVFAGDPEFQ